MTENTTQLAVTTIPAALPEIDVTAEDAILGSLLEKRAEKTNIILSARSVLQRIVRVIAEHNSVRQGIVDRLSSDDDDRVTQKSAIESEIGKNDSEIETVAATVKDLREAFHVSVGKAGLTCNEETVEAIRVATHRSFGAEKAPEEPEQYAPKVRTPSFWERVRDFLLPIAPGAIFAVSGGTVFGIIAPSEIMNFSWPPSGRLVGMLLVGWLMTVYISRSVKKATREYILSRMPVDLNGRKEKPSIWMLLVSFMPGFAELIIDAVGFWQLWSIRAARLARMTGHPTQEVPFIVFMIFGLAAAFGYFLYIFNAERSKTADDQRAAISAFEEWKKYEAAMVKYQARVDEAGQYLRNNSNAQDALGKAGLLAPAVTHLKDLEERRTKLQAKLDELLVPCQPNQAMVAQLTEIRGVYTSCCQRFNKIIDSLDGGDVEGLDRFFSGIPEETGRQ